MKNWLIWFLAGAISMIGGLLALFNPMSAAITATTLGGLALLFVAGLQGYSAWQTRELRGTVSSITVSGSALIGECKRRLLITLSF